MQEGNRTKTDPVICLFVKIEKEKLWWTRFRFFKIFIYSLCKHWNYSKYTNILEMTFAFIVISAWQYQHNSRCCCNKTPETAGRNLDYFYSYFMQEISKVVFKKTMSCNTPSKLHSIQSAQHTLACLLKMRARFRHHTLVINTCTTDRAVLWTTLLISSIYSCSPRWVSKSLNLCMRVEETLGCDCA